MGIDRRTLLLGAGASLMPRAALALNPFAYTWPGSLVPFTDTTGRTSTSSALNGNERTFIAIIEGQSLASCHIPHAYTVTNPTKVHCVNWAGDRLLYQHKEPMMGASFAESSISLWGKLGDLLIVGNVFDRVIWCNVSAGGQQVANLAPGGALGQRIPIAFNVLRSLGITGNQVSAILSMIGESDNTLGTAAETYKGHRRATARVARTYGFTGPWFVPLETYNENAAGVTSATVRQAQADLQAEAGFAAGPDFDVLGSSYRNDGLHQNALGHDTMAAMWFTTLAARFT